MAGPLASLNNMVARETKKRQDAEIAQLENDLYYNGIDTKIAQVPGKYQPAKGTPEYLAWLNELKTISNIQPLEPETTTQTSTPTASTPMTTAGATRDGGRIDTPEAAASPWLANVSAPTEGEIRVAMKDYTDRGLDTALARSRAIADLTTKAEAKAEAAYNTSVEESQLASLIAGMPEKQKGIREALASELGKYESQLFKEELAPEIYQTMAARGLSGGTLDQALAREAGKLSSERERTLAGMGTSSALAQQQLEYENALRTAQTAGLKGSSLEDYYRQLDSSTKERGYSSGQSALQRAFVAQQSELGYQRDMAKLAKQQQYQEEALGQQSSGSLAGLLARAGIGAGIGLIPGVGVTAGALTAASGQLLPKDWYKKID